MSFFEKLNGFTCLIMVGITAYYAHIIGFPNGLFTPASDPNIKTLIGVIVLTIIAHIVVAIAAAITPPIEEGTYPDEREKMIEQRAEVWASVVLSVILVGALVEYSFNGDGNRLFHLVSLGLLISATAKYFSASILLRWV